LLVIIVTFDHVGLVRLLSPPHPICVIHLIHRFSPIKCKIIRFRVYLAL
jgi:hypothetical protein